MRSFRLTWPDAVLAVEVGDEQASIDVRVAWDGRWLVVREDDAPLPRGGDVDIRTHGLWLSLVCETPGEHWTVGLEAFALAVDDPAEDRGDLVALGFDLEWEAPGSVHGEVLIADQRLELDAPAQLTVT